MPEQETSTATDPPASSAGNPSTEERLGRVESAVERIETAIGRLVPGSHAEAQQRTEQRLDRGSSLAEQVRAELARAKEEETAAAATATAAETEQAERRQTAERLARLEERPPAPPRSRRTALLGWGDGRSA
jgi:hypothetical protein